MSNMKMIITSMQLWTKDHNAEYLDATNWAREIALNGIPVDCVETEHIGTVIHPEYFFLAEPDGSFLAKAPVTAITKPASTTVIFELKDAQHNPPYVDAPIANDIGKAISLIDCRHYYQHDACTNVAFADGHIETLPSSKITRALLMNGIIKRH